MKLIRLSLSYLLLVLIPSIAAAEAADVEYLELSSTVTDFQQKITVNNDFTLENVRAITVKALQEPAVESLKRRRFSYSTSMETFEVLEAFTIKADGTRIEVPKDNYQERINKGRGSGGPAFSDRASITVVFPDMEVGDSSYVKTKLTQTEPLFPGYFAHTSAYWPEAPYEKSTVIIDTPIDLALHTVHRDVEIDSRTEGDRQILEFSYQNPKPLKSERQDYSVYDESSIPGFAVSSYLSYQQVADAYGARALPKAKPTARVQQLAQSLVGDEKDPWNKARILYDWVAHKITYAGNCIGVGAVVPRDMSVILDNKMGDCKDKATLLQALLAAVDIDATQALVNSGRNFSLPNPARISTVNHAILYFPQWDLFADPTPKNIPFGLIPHSIQDKPVIIVGDQQPGKRTPAAKPENLAQKLHSEMTFESDGWTSGTITVNLKGLPAASMRASWSELTDQQISQIMERIFSSSTKKGEGSIEVIDNEPLSDEIQYTMTFRKPDAFLNKGAGGFVPHAMAPTTASIYSFLGTSAEPVEGYSVACSNGTSEETLIYKLPDNYQILATPDDFQINENYIEFSASYELKEQTLTVKRTIVDTSPANVCEPDVINGQRVTVTAINEHLQSQVVYQVK
ncbi:DUF3857 domain-containing transglutaminase family protein [Gilvimarinus sp. SDUM040013]|uniref:DUF3857 domain-containing transglutaminase family protein n=1 Tax=Gilvimarinus gilvus TaxID=3058038 RepID=A0ABU4RUZ0_9GAMM|nr:DUF3857 domain-containing transglutaminase family protein [Gilvimarinus sp. SDUM040013]MDO3387929.1 DUF3857 domain-containing transglutaminase family protein [Gilvimarinus sp. SDUM040013]MDX6848700.1 DUF3857 domain-containing transglutaminase family protein [Gilvimarinus sp. SDUM040013]